MSRLHGIFGSEKRPSYADSKVDDTTRFNSKQLTYEVFGSPGTLANISYFDVNGDLQFVQRASVPWSLTFATTSTAVVGSLVAQADIDSDSIGCRIEAIDEIAVGAALGTDRRRAQYQRDLERMRLPDVGISRRHARLDFDGAQVVLTDLGSTNGTMVNGQRVSAVALNPGDMIQLGTTTLTFRADG